MNVDHSVVWPFLAIFGYLTNGWIAAYDCCQNNKTFTQSSPSWYWVLYLYHPITVFVCGSVRYKIAYGTITVWYASTG